MNLTPEQIAANTKSAINIALTQTGLKDKPKTEWTYDERAKYNKALADIIATYPDRFAPSQVTQAKAVEMADYSPLASSDFSFSDFGREVLNNAVAAGDSVAGVGQGVLSTFKLAKWVIPAVGITLVVFWLMGQKKKLAD